MPNHIHTIVEIKNENGGMMNRDEITNVDGHQLQIRKYNRNNHFFQPNYHDHIIRNNFEYQNIKNYIINNPKNWGKDKFNNDIV